jgi:hypothetical protein
MIAPPKPAPAPTPALTEDAMFRVLASVAKKALIDRGWSRAGPWNIVLEDGAPIAGGVLHVSQKTRHADVTVRWNYEQSSTPVAVVERVIIYHWQIAPLEDTETSDEALDLYDETSLNTAIHAAFSRSYERPLGVFFIGERKAELRGLVHAGRLFWQKAF